MQPFIHFSNPSPSGPLTLPSDLESDFWRLKQHQIRFERELERSEQRTRQRYLAEGGTRRALAAVNQPAPYSTAATRTKGGRGPSSNGAVPTNTSTCNGLREEWRNFNIRERYKNPLVEQILQKHSRDCRPSSNDEIDFTRARTLQSQHQRGRVEVKSNDEVGGESDSESDNECGTTDTRLAKRATLPPHLASSNIAKVDNNVTVDLLRRLNLFPAQPRAKKMSKVTEIQTLNPRTQTSASVGYAYRIPSGSYQLARVHKALNAEALRLVPPVSKLKDQAATTAAAAGSLNSHEDPAEEQEGTKPLSMYEPSPMPPLYALTPVAPRVPVPRNYTGILRGDGLQQQPPPPPRRQHHNSVSY